MNQPLVSTITPCYRMEKYLRLFLEQLPRQTFFDRMEVVLDHNEPTDQELEWVGAFQKQYPEKLVHRIVRPVDPIGVSMNRCIRDSKGELLTIWNVDDLRTPDSIEAQAAVLQSNSTADIVYGNFWEVKSFGATDGRFIRHESIPHTELTRSMILGPFFMFRKSLCDKAGMFDEQLRSAADFDLAVRLSMHGRAQMASVPLGYYLNEGLGASTRPGQRPLIERTVIDLRYGIYDKVLYDLAAQAARYSIPTLLLGDRWIPVREVVPNYESFLDQRYRQWHASGLKAYRQKTGALHRGVRALKRRSAQLMSGKEKS